MRESIQQGQRANLSGCEGRVRQCAPIARVPGQRTRDSAHRRILCGPQVQFPHREGRTFRSLHSQKVLDVFQRALARESEWPTSGDQARPYSIPDVDKDLRQRGSRIESDIARSRITSGTPNSLEPPNDLPGGGRRSGQALQSGSRRSHRLATAARGGSGAQTQSGSRSRKRSREAREMTNDADDAHSDDERAKRTRTNSERQRDAAQGGRKQPKVRRGRK